MATLSTTGAQRQCALQQRVEGRELSFIPCVGIAEVLSSQCALCHCNNHSHGCRSTPHTPGPHNPPNPSIVLTRVTLSSSQEPYTLNPPPSFAGSQPACVLKTACQSPNLIFLQVQGRPKPPKPLRFGQVVPFLAKRRVLKRVSPRQGSQKAPTPITQSVAQSPCFRALLGSGMLRQSRSRSRERDKASSSGT